MSQHWSLAIFEEFKKQGPMDFTIALHYAGHVFFLRLRSLAFHSFPRFVGAEAEVDWKGIPIKRLSVRLLGVVILLLVCPFRSAVSEETVPSKPGYETPGPDKSRARPAIDRLPKPPAKPVGRGSARAGELRFGAPVSAHRLVRNTVGLRNRNDF